MSVRASSRHHAHRSAYFRPLRVPCTFPPTCTAALFTSPRAPKRVLPPSSRTPHLPTNARRTAPLFVRPAPFHQRAPYPPPLRVPRTFPPTRARGSSPPSLPLPPLTLLLHHPLANPRLSSAPSPPATSRSSRRGRGGGEELGGGGRRGGVGEGGAAEWVIREGGSSEKGRRGLWEGGGGAQRRRRGRGLVSLRSPSEGGRHPSVQSSLDPYDRG